MKNNEELLKKALVQIKNTEPLEGVLKHEFHYLKFIERILIPEIGESEMHRYLKSMVEKEITVGRMEILRGINIAGVCKLVFKSNVKSKKDNLGNRYPKLKSIIFNVITETKFVNKLDEIAILKRCEEKIKNRESLKSELQIYKKYVDWKYLYFVETILIPNIGVDEFYNYILDFQYNASMQGQVKTYSSSELLNMVIDDEDYKRGQIVKSKERYPTLFNIVEKVIFTNARKGVRGEKYQRETNLKLKVQSFNKISNTEFLNKVQFIIDNEFNFKRKRINKISFYRILFDEYKLPKNSFYKIIIKDLIHYKELNEFLEKELISQIKFIEEWNKQSLKVSNDEWIIYFSRGLSLHTIKIEFCKITSKPLRRELKLYFLHDFNPSNPSAIYKKFTDIMRGLEVIQEKFNPKNLAEIEVLQVLYMYQHLEKNSKYSVVTIKKTVSNLSQLVDYFLDKEGYKDRPQKNVFKAINMRNTDSMSQNTRYIPDVVIEQLNSYITELDLIYRVMYELYSYTGMRPKEAVELENNCFDEDNNEHIGFVKMKYVPHKIKNARRRRGLSDYLYIYIPVELADEIKKIIEHNSDICSKYKLSYVFVRRTHAGIYIPKTRDFCLAINNIIKKYDICDLDGERWNFTAKQTRKTVAVNLIENATPQEVANQLGHLSVQTTEKYYLEVRKEKLVTLNSEFFENKFEVHIGKENLDLYNEEERRQLYVDFCLNHRDIELGKCSKHISEGDCGKRVGASNCAVCPKLCTGEIYLSKWNELRDSQINIINDLEKVYRDNGIEDFHEFIEYKKERYLYERYQSVIEAIIGAEKSC